MWPTSTVRSGRPLAPGRRRRVQLKARLGAIPFKYAEAPDLAYGQRPRRCAWSSPGVGKAMVSVGTCAIAG
jgi:hypothetical protein